VTRSIGLTALVLSLALLVGPVSAAPGAPGHSHNDSTFAAGEPGDPRRPARVVLVTMREGDGTMMFIPDRLEVRRGEQVRFILTNVGHLGHEFVLATVEENLRHAEQMRRNPEMEHDDPNGRRLAPRRTAELLWRFTRVGEFEYGCLIPGHRGSGMVGTVIVR
jgi:uncharacterized cupredoxin-like copper-binding protein